MHRNRNIPHVGQDTNTAIDSFHTNMKWILYSSQEKLTSCKMDWFIYNLVGDVKTHYRYMVQCKTFKYVKNKMQGRHCCQCPLANSWYFRYKCHITPKCRGHCICGIHQPPRKTMDCRCSNFKMATMRLPLGSTSTSWKFSRYFI